MSMQTLVRNCVVLLTVPFLTVTAVISPTYAFKPADVDKLRQTGNCQNCDLSGADLSGADLGGAGLVIEANRRYAKNAADLSGANLSGANITEAQLRVVKR
jgi:hypothetical protein